MHRRLWLNDPDFLVARDAQTGLSSAERRARASAIAVGGGIAIFSDDLPSLSPTSRNLVRETVTAAREVDAMENPGSTRTLDRLGGGSPLGPPEPLLGSAPGRRVDGGGEALEVDLEAHDGALFRSPRRIVMAVFCDFDGTFSIQDVGATLAKIHAADRRPAVWARYERGEITAWEYNMEILDGLPLPQNELESFLRTIRLDPGARDLVDWCAKHDVVFRILSDGFDYNLDRLQELHGVHFEYDANALRYEDGAWRIRGGHPNRDCQCGTGTCKRGRIEAFRAAHPGIPTVHIGNGRVSDLCGALAADHAFAKDTLAAELARRQERFERFATLHDVIPHLQRILDRG